MNLSVNYLEGLATETGFLRWSVLKPLTALSDDEREYIDRVHAGELAPELLFPDDSEMANRLQRHPALFAISE